MNKPVIPIERAGMHYPIQECFEFAKDAACLDEYEVRRHKGWYHHIGLAVAAQAFLAGVRARALPGAEKSRPRKQAS